MKQFPARMQSEDALAAQLAKLGLQDGRVPPAAAAEDAEPEEPVEEPAAPVDDPEPPVPPEG